MANIGKKAIKDRTTTDMKALGVYKPEYEGIIEIYAELVDQYNKITKEFKEGGYKYEVETDQGGKKKAPIVATLETLRKDILAYSDRLCLNPKSLETVTPDSGGGKPKSPLALALREMA
ncbi:P27 family phage terminase small subunit [Paenibacillus sp. BR1-192]|uniref:P27 family phage terminase small subunit n=1 Tax=Paenibacillus sp. BR1-192 TaxID=3032287 RepID=UPI00240E572E|nr:P27 family phage terminase small subunit [Paenibacillus sp. BR1-192]WFB57480.1 P27 family phage terminase small subunit [Paenibacillus sp. BR1-192]